ncbi:MAG: HNH endonuclease [Elusimicrobia bacterium]|nr:HNH endonuclease [Elusimicrobiota bacterium]
MSRTLVLNRSFRAVAVADWRRAVTLVYAGLAEALDAELVGYDFSAWVAASSSWVRAPGGFVRSTRLRFAVPEVIRLTRYDRVPRRDVAFTRHNVFARDRHRCAYCGRRQPPDALDLDHVVPRSRGGPHDWTNVVASCRPCNLRKADRLPDEADMPLKARPEKPRWSLLGSLIPHPQMDIPDSWRRLLVAEA